MYRVREIKYIVVRFLNNYSCMTGTIEGRAGEWQLMDKEFPFGVMMPLTCLLNFVGTWT